MQFTHFSFPALLSFIASVQMDAFMFSLFLWCVITGMLQRHDFSVSVAVLCLAKYVQSLEVHRLQFPCEKIALKMQPGGRLHFLDMSALELSQ